MSEARPSHIFALIPFHPDELGNDAECRRLVDAWVLAHNKDYALDTPRLVDRPDGNLFMYMSGNLVEYIVQQSGLQIDVTLQQQELAERKASGMRPRIAEVVSGASRPSLHRG